MSGALADFSPSVCCQRSSDIVFACPHHLSDVVPRRFLRGGDVQLAVQRLDPRLDVVGTTGATFRGGGVGEISRWSDHRASEDESAEKRCGREAGDYGWFRERVHQLHLLVSRYRMAIAEQMRSIRTCGAKATPWFRTD